MTLVDALEPEIDSEEEKVSCFYILTCSFDFFIFEFCLILGIGI
jgi:hypothetical protein